MSRGVTQLGIVFLCVLIIILTPCHGAPMDVQHVCLSDGTDPNLIKVRLAILQHQDPILAVYAFNAAGTDTASFANRDNACTQGPTSDADNDPIVFDITVDITVTSTQDCGSYLYTLSGTSVTVARFLFRVYSSSITMLSETDKVYVFECRSDALNGNYVTTQELNIKTSPAITLLESKPGVSLLVRDATSKVPVSNVAIGDKLMLSVGLNPDPQRGPDNYGVNFFVGFLGNDAISATSASVLTVEVIPRFAVRTDILVTSNAGEEAAMTDDGSPVVFTFPSEMMGCSDGGEVELAKKGIKIETFDQEVGVLVCNREADSADCYMALPFDVLGSEYYAVSMETTVDASEMMIIATEDNTDVDVTLSAGTTLTINLNSTVSATAGETFSVTLGERDTLHLAVSSDSVPESLTGYKISAKDSKRVSLITGNRKVGNEHVADQLPPVGVPGTHYALIPVDLAVDGRLTTYVVQALEDGDTIVTQHLASSTVVRTLTLGSTSSTTFDVQSGAPCELIADKRILVTQFQNGPTVSGDPYEQTMLVLPSVSQWAPTYKLLDVNNLVKVPLVFKSEASASNFLLNGNPVPITGTTEVSGPSGYRFFTGNPFTDYSTAPISYELSTSDEVVTFMALAYLYHGATDIGIGYQLLGVRLAKKCYPVGHKNDGLDNDCDGKIDEEKEDGKDNDDDGKIDEDTGGTIVIELVGIVGVRPINCRVSGLRDFSDSSLIMPMTGSDGCAVTNSTIMVPTSEFVYQTATNVGNGVQQKFHYSGIFSAAMFIDYFELFFMCDVIFCYSASDPACTTACVPPGARRKRQSSSNKPPNNVTAEVSISPYGGNEGQNTGNQNDVIYSENTGQCLSEPQIQAILGFMAALSLVSTISAIFFCCLLRRRRRRRRHVEVRKKIDDTRSYRSSGIFYAMR